MRLGAPLFRSPVLVATVVVLTESGGTYSLVSASVGRHGRLCESSSGLAPGRLPPERGKRALGLPPPGPLTPIGITPKGAIDQHELSPGPDAQPAKAIGRPTLVDAFFTGPRVRIRSPVSPCAVALLLWFLSRRPVELVLLAVAGVVRHVARTRAQHDPPPGAAVSFGGGVTHFSPHWVWMRTLSRLWSCCLLLSFAGVFVRCWLAPCRVGSAELPRDPASRGGRLVESLLWSRWARAATSYATSGADAS